MNENRKNQKKKIPKRKRKIFTHKTNEINGIGKINCFGAIWKKLPQTSGNTKSILYRWHSLVKQTQLTADENLCFFFLFVCLWTRFSHRNVNTQFSWTNKFIK